MHKILKNSLKVFFILFFLSFSYFKAYGDEIETILKQFESLQKDIKTLEKAVYSQDVTTSSSDQKISNNNDDVLTKHLLKLSELEEQFRALTNNFEEINFKLDKLSNRITKVQTDNQIRFQDLETGKINLEGNTAVSKKKKLPGSDLPEDLGSISETEVTSIEQVQKTQSIESVGTVVTETQQRTEKILPDTSPEEQYKFAISFLKIGDYETAEFALREFVEVNSKHNLAGNAQYWYGETFRIRQLYQDAATAYLDGYQKYPNSAKAPVNLLKLGVSLVQIGEKDQGCSMITGVSKQYPKASQSVLQKAIYEGKKFDCPTKKS